MSLLKNAKKRLIGVTLSFILVGSLSNFVYAKEYKLGSDTAVTVFAEGITSEDYVSVADGYYLTMTVDGVEVPYVVGKAYTGNVEFKVTPALGKIGSLDTHDSNNYKHRTALYVNKDGIVKENSVLSAILTGTRGQYTENGVNGIIVNSETPGFSSIIVENNKGNGTKYFTIKDSVFNAFTDSDGSDASDFTGYGAAISGYGDVNLTLDNVKVNTEGVAKVAFLADQGADMLVKNSKFTVIGGTLYDNYLNNAAFNKMVAPPWVLGISGNARGTNLLGENSTHTFVDCDFEVNDWGVLSVDAGLHGSINVINSDLRTISNTGYGIYVIGEAVENMYGVRFDVGTYPAILTGGSIRFTSSEGVKSYETVNGLGETIYNNIKSERAGRPTVVNSQFGVMAHNSGKIILEKDTEFHTKNAAFLIKSGQVDISVDDSTLDVEDGTILQMIDNDDSTVGVNVELSTELNTFPIFNTVFNEAAGYPATAFAKTTADAVTAKFTNVDLEGNMYNATGYVADPKGLSVTLGENATLKGAISASSAMHVQMELSPDGYYYDYVKDADGNYVQATNFTIDEYYLLGHVVNKPYDNGYNKVEVKLTDNAKWTVTDSSYLSSLTVGKDAMIKASMTVNGVKTPIVAGQTYIGNIILTPAS